MLNNKYGEEPFIVYPGSVVYFRSKKYAKRTPINPLMDSRVFIVDKLDRPPNLKNYKKEHFRALKIGRNGKLLNNMITVPYHRVHKDMSPKVVLIEKKLLNLKAN